MITKKTYSIFPTNLHEYEIENPFVNSEIISLLEEEEFIDNGNHIVQEPFRSYQTKHDLHKKIQYIGITSFIKDCLKQYKEELNYDCESLEITSCWANKYPRGTQSQQMPHTHLMSLISGVYYLTEGSPTVFNDPLFQRTSMTMMVANSENMIRQSIFAAEPGKLVLFPSWLEHGTFPHKEVYDRWSIAFNVMPSGKINSNFGASGIPSCDLEIK